LPLNSAIKLSRTIDPLLQEYQDEVLNRRTAIKEEYQKLDPNGEFLFECDEQRYKQAKLQGYAKDQEYEDVSEIPDDEKEEFLDELDVPEFVREGHPGYSGRPAFESDRNEQSHNEEMTDLMSQDIDIVVHKFPEDEKWEVIRAYKRDVLGYDEDEIADDNENLRIKGSEMGAIAIMLP